MLEIKVYEFIRDTQRFGGIADDKEKAKLQANFAAFKEKNSRMLKTLTMIPDSILIK